MICGQFLNEAFQICSDVISEISFIGRMCSQKEQVILGPETPEMG